MTASVPHDTDHADHGGPDHGGTDGTDHGGPAHYNTDHRGDRPGPAASAGLVRTAGLPYFVIAFIARLPYAMMVVGVLTLVVSARGSLSLGGVNSAAVGLGTACFGPLLGAAADRFGQRRTLLVVAIVNGMLLAAIAWVVYSPWGDPAVLATSFLIGASAPQVSPMSRSRLVGIIAERLHPARRDRTFNSTMAYESAADETTFVFGPFIVGLLASLIAPWAPLVGAAVLTLVFVGAFALHPTSPPPRRRTGHDAPRLDPVAHLFRPSLAVVVTGIFGVGLFFGAMLTSLTSFMDDLGAPEQAGLLYGVMGIGSAALALGVAFFPAAFTLRWRLLACVAVMVGGTALLPTVTTVGGMVAVLAVTGIGVGPTLVTLYSFGALRSPAGRSATVMAILGSGVIVGQSAASAVVGEIGQSLGTGAALVTPLIAAAIVLAAAVANWFLSGADARRAPADPLATAELVVDERGVI